MRLNVNAWYIGLRMRVVCGVMELLLDPDIRLWVILPIVLITLLFGLVRHYVTVLLKQDQTPELEKIKDA